MRLLCSGRELWTARKRRDRAAGEPDRRHQDHAQPARDCRADSRQRVEHPERLHGAGRRREFVLEFFRPRRQRLPYDHIHQHDDREQGEKAGGEIEVASFLGRLPQETAEPRQAVGGGTGGDDFARDKEVPAGDPRQDRVVHQLRYAGGQQQALEPQPSASAESLERLTRVVGNCFDGFVNAERHVPRLAGEDEKDRRHLDAEAAAMGQRDEEKNRGGKKPTTGTDCAMSMAGIRMRS